jgi:hypothetical protein
MSSLLRHQERTVPRAPRPVGLVRRQRRSEIVVPPIPSPSPPTVPSVWHQYVPGTDWRYGSSVPCCQIESQVKSGRPVRVLVGVAPGTLYRATALLGETPDEAARGTWEISFYRPDDQPFRWVLASPTPSAETGLWLEVGETVSVCYHLSGLSTTIISAPNQTLLPGAWHRIRVTRRRTGQWALDHLSDTSWTNLVTVKSAKPIPELLAKYQVLCLAPGQLVSLGTVAGYDAIAKRTT